MRDFVQDLRYAIRQMARKPGMTIFAVLSLALGIGANSSIFSLVNAILFRELPAQRPQELVDVYSGKEGEFQYAIQWSCSATGSGSSASAATPKSSGRP
jgi:hypothetical protein